MVSYGDSEFRQWAEDAGFNDDDLALMRKTVTGRKWLWLALYLAGCAGTAVSSIIAFSMFFTLPFFLESWIFASILKNGSFDVKPGFLWTILYFVEMVSFLCIFPIFIWRGCKNKQWGTGINGLMKKGLIGNH